MTEKGGLIIRLFDFIQTSVFTDDRYLFSGNQLATFCNLKKNDLSQEEMQGITREMNFSETTFVFPSSIEKCIRNVRIFTPASEIPFAGHPTLGTAFVLKRQKITEKNQKSFFLELGIGPIEVSVIDENHIQMSQAPPQFLEVFKDKKSMAEILGVSPDVIIDKFPMQFVSTGFPFLIVPITSMKAIKKVQLNPTLLMETLKDFSSQALVILTPETIHSNSHAHVRMFAPSAGVPEDPATGSAAGPIGGYLEVNNVIDNHLRGSKIVLEQGYEINRPSRLFVECVFHENEIINALVSGTVKLTAEGKFILQS